MMSKRDTPFSLVYDDEVIMALKLDIPSFRVKLEGLILDEEARQTRLDKLTLLYESYVNAIKYHKVYQE